MADTETHRQHAQAYQLAGFCRAYGVSRSKAHLEIKAGRLKARKMGTRVIITVEDADAWLSGLPTVSPKAA